MSQETCLIWTTAAFQGKRRRSEGFLKETLHFVLSSALYRAFFVQ